jgi:endonuclease/exonuclease/phosphatase family metal-dependent hydrolase
MSDKWIIIGDFNMILSAADKSNDNLNRRLMVAFQAVVKDLELKELSLRGRKFTWSNNQAQTRIDRVLCTMAWDLMMPNMFLQALSSRVSDHCPLLIAGRSTEKKSSQVSYLRLFGQSFPTFRRWFRIHEPKKLRC